ncbi:DoxX family protein [Nocardia sp. XZ_19_385]|uniref:DoxX family protein n=1 Tax=Nocardia sp. XZ_19_385 TaxID=2769488 RepID=UPI00188EF01A|nr:DoxX family protein [Nocardia sp. XZ_19_385]
MFVATVIITVLLAVGLIPSAYFKFSRKPEFVEGYKTLGVPDTWLNPLAAALLAGSVGLLIGLWWPPIGIAAAIGLILYFLGALGFHVKAKDYKNMGVPAAILALAIAALVLRLLTM